MVEEFMLLANVTVARAITSAFPQCAMLRRHPPPTPGAFDELARSLALQGFDDFDASSSLALTASLDAAVKPDEPYFNELTRYMAVRAMPAANWSCTITCLTTPARRSASDPADTDMTLRSGWQRPLRPYRAPDPKTEAGIAHDHR